MKKWIAIIVASIAVILVCFGVIFTRQQKQSVTPTKNRSGLRIQKQKMSNSKKGMRNTDNITAEFSNDEWMLMGYMAYAHDNYVQSRHIKNTADLVNDVSEDLTNGDLKATKSDDTNYQLGNKFGSVNVVVEDSDVKVTGDGDFTTAKTELKNKFGTYTSQIQKMTKAISSGSSNSSSSKQEANLGDQELAVAVFIDDYNSSSDIPQKISKIESTIKKQQAPDYVTSGGQDYLSGLYHGTHKGQAYYGIAGSFSTSAYTNYYINDTDRIGVQPGGANLGMDGPKKYKSKAEIIKKYSPYKNDVDQILQGLEYNKSQMKQISKKLNKQAEEETKN